MTSSKTKTQLLTAMKKLGSPERATHSQYFFKTGPGQYGAHDIFLGLSVPQMRLLSKEFRDLDIKTLESLLADKFHESRMVALQIIVDRYRRAKTETERRTLYQFYLKHRAAANNWDLVDLSAPQVVGDYLFRQPKERKILAKLVKSKTLWDRRIAIVSTLTLIKKDQFADTLYLAEALLKDKEDLMHKATGWMLREVGKRDLKTLTAFLDRYAPEMPRTALRYALEKLTPAQREHYLKMKKNF